MDLKGAVEQATKAVASATQTLNAAIELGEGKGEILRKEMEAARTSAEELNQAGLAIAQAPDENKMQVSAEAIKRSAVALTSSSGLIGAISLVAGGGSALDEWKECRATIDRCDKLLVDLRKTGFGFVTAVVGAASFLFKEPDLAGTRVSIACMLVLLILLLYVVDIAHQTWLDTAVRIAKTREAALGFSITEAIGKRFSAAYATGLGFGLYLALLAATCGIFWFSIPHTEGFLSGHRNTLYGAFAVGASLMIVGQLMAARRP